MTYNEYVLDSKFHYNMQGLISNNWLRFDDDNIQDTFISHLNQLAKIQKLLTHDRASPVKSIKLSYSAGLYIHTIGGIVKQFQSKRC